MKIQVGFLALMLGAFGQTLPSAAPFRSAIAQFVDSNGTPIAGGKLYTCIAGLSCSQTSPPGNALATYTDSTAMVQNTNPIVLDSAGRAQIWLGPQAYRLVLVDANSVLQWTQDNVADTTLYFVNYVKTAGTATLISYTNPVSGAVARTVSARLAERTSVKDFGAVCDGTTDDTAAITAAINANVTLFFPPGTCKVNNNPNPLTFTNWSGAAIFDPAAKILCNYAHQGCFLFNGGTNILLANFSYTYGVSEPTDQCPDHGGAGNCWGINFNGGVNTTILNFTVNNGYGVGLNMQGGMGQECIAPQVIGARITNTSRDGLHIQNCSFGVVSDVYVNNSGDDSFGFQNSTDRPDDHGMVATNLYSYNSLGSCISASGSNFAISNFMCDAPSTGGVLISYPGFALRPFSGTIAHGVIRNVAFRSGGICDCGQRGIDFFQGVDTVSFDDIIIQNTNGSGILMETFMETPPIVPTINFSNIQVTNTGANGNTDGAGHCLLAQAATNVTVKNLYLRNCAGFGAAFANITTVNASGLQIINASTASQSYVGHSAVNVTGVTNWQMSDVHILDDQMAATGYAFNEGGTVTSGGINNLQAYIQNGTFSFNIAAPTKAFNILDMKVPSSSSNVGFASVGGTGSAIPFLNPITVTDPGAANLISAASGPASTSTSAIVVGNGAVHQQAAFGMCEGDCNNGGTLKWSFLKGKDTEMIPDYFAIFDAANNRDSILVNPNPGVSGYKERIQMGPSGDSLFWAVLPVYASNAAAISGGLTAGDHFRDSGGIVHVVF